MRFRLNSTRLYSNWIQLRWQQEKSRKEKNRDQRLGDHWLKLFHAHLVIAFYGRFSHEGFFLAKTASLVQGHATVFSICSFNHLPLLLPIIYMSPLFLEISVSSSVRWKYEDISQTDMMNSDSTRVWVWGFSRVFYGLVVKVLKGFRGLGMFPKGLDVSLGPVFLCPPLWIDQMWSIVRTLVSFFMRLPLISKFYPNVYNVFQFSVSFEVIFCTIISNLVLPAWFYSSVDAYYYHRNSFHKSVT